MSKRVGRLGRLSSLALLALAAAAAACVYSSPRDFSIRVAATGIDSSALDPRSRLAEGSDRFLALRPRPSKRRMGFARLPVDLWAPFELSVAFGSFAAGSVVSDLSYTCLTLWPPQEPNFVAALCAVFVSGGSALRIDVVTDSSFPIGSIELPGTRSAELRIEVDANEIRFFGRAVGGTNFTPVAEVPFIQTEPLRVEVSVESGAPSEVGFDLAHLAMSPPPSPTPEEAIASDVARALSAGLEAYFLLDGGAPGFVAAGAKLIEAQAALQSARARAAPGTAKAMRWIDQAEHKLAKAIVQNERQNAARALDALQKSGQKQIRALGLLVPNRL